MSTVTFNNTEKIQDYTGKCKANFFFLPKFTIYLLEILLMGEITDGIISSYSYHIHYLTLVTTIVNITNSNQLKRRKKIK